MKILTRNTATLGDLIIAVIASVVCVYVSCTCLSSRLECNSLFDRLGAWGFSGAVSKKKIGCNSVDDNRDGLNV